MLRIAFSLLISHPIILKDLLLFTESMALAMLERCSRYLHIYIHYFIYFLFYFYFFDWLPLICLYIYIYYTPYLYIYTSHNLITKLCLFIIPFRWLSPCRNWKDITLNAKHIKKIKKSLQKVTPQTHLTLI